MDACLWKGQAHYVDIERAQCPKQACQVRRTADLSGLQCADTNKANARGAKWERGAHYIAHVD